MSGSRAGLVLTSGGARGAYQAGVLRAIGHLMPSGSNPFPILSGVSAGSLNAGFLAARSVDFRTATERLADLWSRLRPSDVFRTDTLSLSKIGLGWITDLSLGGFLGAGHARALLDTSPMRKLLAQVFDVGLLDANLKSELVRGLAVSATNYNSGTAVTFYEGASDIEPWIRTTRIGIPSKITVDHLMASSAIPVFFPPIAVDGAYYGDGSVRLTAPLSPAIHLGADRVLAIGIRRERDDATTVSLNKETVLKAPTIADVGGVMLNAMFLDGLESDLERMARINQTIGLFSPEQRKTNPNALREIPVMALRPSQDLGAIVARSIDLFPLTVRHLLKGLGASSERGWDLLSYLAFDVAYTQPLVDLGYKDGLDQGPAIIKFLTA